MKRISELINDFVQRDNEVLLYKFENRVNELFSLQTLSPLFEELDEPEMELCFLLLRFLNADSDEMARLLAQEHPILLSEEAILFLNIFVSDYYTDEAQQHTIDIKTEQLLKWRSEENKVDDDEQMIFDFLDMSGHVASLSQTSKVYQRYIQHKENVRAYIEERQFGLALEEIVRMYYQFENQSKDSADENFDFHNEVGLFIITWILYISDIVLLASTSPLHIHIIAEASSVIKDDFINTIEYLAETYWDAGVHNFTQSIKLFIFAYYIRREQFGDKDPTTISIRRHIAKLYYCLGDVEAALHEIDDALESYAFAKNQASLLATINLAIQLYLESGDQQWAMELMKRADELMDSSSADHAITLYLQALIKYKLKDYLSALPLLVKALDLQKDLIGVQHPDYAASMQLLASIEYAQGNFEAAIDALEAVLQIRKDKLGNEHPDTISSLYLLALLKKESGDFENAIFIFKEAFDAETKTVLRLFPQVTERQRLIYLPKIKRNFNLALSNLVTIDPIENAKVTPIAYEFVLRRKGIETETSKYFRSKIVVEPRSNEFLLNLQSKIANIALSGSEDYDVRDEQIEALVVGDFRMHKEVAEIDLLGKISNDMKDKLFESLYNKGHQQIASKLSPQEAFIEFVLLQPFNVQAADNHQMFGLNTPVYLAFVIRSDSSVMMINLGDAKEINQHIATYRDMIRKNEIAGHHLRKLLFDPLGINPTSYKRLIIAPDGELSNLPFDTLPFKDGKFLIDLLDVFYMGSGRDFFVRSKRSVTTPQKSLVVADPDFNHKEKFEKKSEGNRSDTWEKANNYIHSDYKRSILQFEPLPGTEVEGKTIADMIGATLLTGKFATKNRLKKMKSPKILHIATHGFFFPKELSYSELGAKENNLSSQFSPHELDNPLLRSGLALAGANHWLQHGESPGAGEGILTADDVTGLDLSSTDLVVLSACETGLGDVEVGEGVFGLRRAFTLVGARMLIISLWKVPDLETQELMVEFYRLISKGRPVNDSLRQAKIAIKKKYPDPYYWGAFICQGIPGQLS